LAFCCCLVCSISSTQVQNKNRIEQFKRTGYASFKSRIKIDKEKKKVEMSKKTNQVDKKRGRISSRKKSQEEEGSVN
jgi:hypothetical protein